jgi:hypothetical protein
MILLAFQTQKSQRVGTLTLLRDRCFHVLSHHAGLTDPNASDVVQTLGTRELSLFSLPSWLPGIAQLYA